MKTNYKVKQGFIAGFVMMVIGSCAVAVNSETPLLAGAETVLFCTLVLLLMFGVMHLASKGYSGKGPQFPKK
jgi:hypothetical protein